MHFLVIFHYLLKENLKMIRNAKNAWYMACAEDMCKRDCFTVFANFFLSRTLNVWIYPGEPQDCTADHLDQNDTLNQWRSQEFGLGAFGHFWLKSIVILHFCKNAKTPFYLVRSNFGLGVQMPHCTPSGYATALDHILTCFRSKLSCTDHFKDFGGP